MAIEDTLERNFARKYGLNPRDVRVDYPLSDYNQYHEVKYQGRRYAVIKRGRRGSFETVAIGEQNALNKLKEFDQRKKDADRARKERERQKKLAKFEQTKRDIDAKSKKAVTDFRKRQEEIRTRPPDVQQYQTPSVEAGQTPLSVENTMQPLNPNDQRVVDEQRRTGNLPEQTATQQPQQPAGTPQPQPQQPAGGQQQYVIQQGDNLSSLALRFGTTVQEILRLNPTITNPNLIRTGANLILPGQTPQPDGQQPTGDLQPTGVQPPEIENTMQPLNPDDQRRVDDLRRQGVIPEQDTFDYSGTGTPETEQQPDPVVEMDTRIDTSIQELETTLGDLSKNTFENLLNSPDVANTVVDPNLEDTIADTTKNNFYRNIKIDVSKINTNDNPITFDTKEFDASVYKQQIITQKVLDQSPPDAYKDKNVIDTTNRISELYDEMYDLKDAKNDILKFVKKKGQGNLSFALLESFSMVKTKEVNYQIDRISRQIDTANRVLKTQLDRYAVLSENFWKNRQFLLQVAEMNLKETELARQAFDRDRTYRLNLQKLKIDQLNNDRNYQLKALQHNLMVDKTRADTLDRDRRYNLDVAKTKADLADRDRQYRLDVTKTRADVADRDRRYKLDVQKLLSDRELKKKELQLSTNTEKDRIALLRQQVGYERDRVNLQKAQVQLDEVLAKKKTQTPAERYAKLRTGIKAAFNTQSFATTMNTLKTLSGDVKSTVANALGYKRWNKSINTEIDDIARDYGAILQKIHNDTASDEEVDKFMSLRQLLKSKSVGLL